MTLNAMTANTVSDELRRKW